MISGCGGGDGTVLRQMVGLQGVDTAAGPCSSRLRPVDEYQIEIQSIRRTLSRLKGDKAEPALIEEYEAELRNLVALYDAATAAFESGDQDGRLETALGLLGFGDWSFDNVYSFVYDAALETEAEDDRDLANIINHTDYAATLRRALEG